MENLSTSEILAYLQTNRNILIPLTIHRDWLSDEINTIFSDEQWETECENIKDVFSEPLFNNLMDELHEQFNPDND